MKELNIKLNINELNLVLEALGHQSYVRVYELIENLQNQAKAQMNGGIQSVGSNNDDGQLDAKAAASMSSN